MRYRAVNFENFHALLGPLRLLSWKVCVDLFKQLYSTHRELYFDTHECCLQLRNGSFRVKHVGPLEFSILIMHSVFCSNCVKMK